jgi:acetyl esterase/lipase
MPYPFTSIYFDDTPIEGRVLDIFHPAKVTRDLALFFVHGGGWRAGSRSQFFHGLMRAFNAEGFLCASTDYRLAGVTILDQITDVRHGYDLFLNHLAAQKRPRKVCLYGESAGAHLAALLALARPGECGEQLKFGTCEPSKDWIRPVGVALQSAPHSFEPWEDIFPQIWTIMQDIAGVPYERDPGLYRRVSPVNYATAGAPPIFFLEAENEHVFSLRNNLAFIEKLKAAGCRAERKVYTNAEHGFFYALTRRQQKEAFADLLAFFKSLER